jgi:hypothetical protein
MLLQPHFVHEENFATSHPLPFYILFNLYMCKPASCYRTSFSPESSPFQHLSALGEHASSNVATQVLGSRAIGEGAWLHGAVVGLRDTRSGHPRVTEARHCFYDTSGVREVIVSVAIHVAAHTLHLRDKHRESWHLEHKNRQHKMIYDKRRKDKRLYKIILYKII